MRIALDVPPDGRIRLSFDLPWLWEYEVTMMRLDTEKELTSEDKGKLQKAFESKMQWIETFHKDLYKSGDFYILDCNLDSNLTDQDPILVMYRPGSVHAQMYPFWKATYVDGSSRTSEWSANQWARVIFCQGLSSVLAANDLARWKDSWALFSYLPYLVVETYKITIDKTIKLHIDCSRRVGSKLANPYRDVDNGFHITFYERVELSSGHESWKTGHLYKKADGPKGNEQRFRQSAFTMFATSNSLKSAPESSKQLSYWTILLLTPSGFFEEPQQDLTKSGLAWKKEVGQHRSKLIAELTCIVSALKVVVNRWADLHQYVGDLISGKNFMNPKAYVEFLFDDETFSQSRLYFWVIGCLNEFDISIEDNIKQWTLFREARVAPYIGDLGGTSQNGDSSTIYGMTSESLNQFRALDKKADDLCEALANLRRQFQNQRTTTLALRDGLASLSNLAANQASLRMTANMKNLTVALAEDSSNMKIIAILTALFLPGTFMAVLLTTPMFKWPDPPDGQIVVRLPFEIYWAVSGSVTLTLGFGMLFWFGGLGWLFGRLKRLRQKERFSTRRNKESGPETRC